MCWKMLDMQVNGDSNVYKKFLFGNNFLWRAILLRSPPIPIYEQSAYWLRI